MMVVRTVTFMVMLRVTASRVTRVIFATLGLEANRQVLEEAFLPLFLLLQEAFELELVVAIVADVTGGSLLDDHAHFALRDYVDGIAEVALVDHCLLVDVDLWPDVVGDEHDLVVHSLLEDPQVGQLLVHQIVQHC